MSEKLWYFSTSRKKTWIIFIPPLLTISKTESNRHKINEWFFNDLLAFKVYVPYERSNFATSLKLLIAPKEKHTFIIGFTSLGSISHPTRIMILLFLGEGFKLAWQTGKCNFYGFFANFQRAFSLKNTLYQTSKMRFGR